MFDAYLKRGARLSFALIGIFVFMAHAASAEDQGPQLRELRKEVEELRMEFHRIIAEKEKKISRLETQLKALQEKTDPAAATKTASAGESALDKALREIEPSREQRTKDDVFPDRWGAPLCG